MMDRKPWYVICAVLQVVCWIAVLMPTVFGVNRIEPFVLGLPLFFAWFVLWIVISIIGLLALYWLDYGGSR